MERAPTHYPSIVFTLRFEVESIQEFAGASNMAITKNKVTE
jgi:hypothetical protein